MDFTPDADQLALVSSTRDFIASRFPLDHVASRFDSDDVRWKELADLGWLGLGVAEADGGFGASLLEEALVFREIGAALVPGPIRTTLAAARLAVWSGAADLARTLIDGRVRVARAVRLENAVGDGDTMLLADPVGSELTLRVTPEEAALVSTPPGIELVPGLEDGTTLGRTHPEALADALISTGDTDLTARLSGVLTILTCAELTGMARATADAATEYAKTRIQFGKAIGAFQSVKHSCADMAINAHAAEHAMLMAALTQSDYDLLAAASFCRRAALSNARSNIHVHGAFGFSAESAAHRFLKRAHILSATNGLDRAALRLATKEHP